MMRNRSLSVILAAAALVAAPSLLAAQQVTVDTTARAVTDTTTQPATHTVVKGETLWALAQRYLNNPFSWPMLLDLNKTIIADPHWIYPGQVLRLPGAVTSVSIAVSGYPEIDTTHQQVVVALDSVGAPPPALPVDTAAAPPAPVAPTVNPATAPTVFRRVTPVVASNVTVTESVPAEPTVATGLYEQAPFVVKTGGVSATGQLVRSADLNALGDADTRRMFKAYDNVLLKPSKGVTFNPGDRLVVVRKGPSIRDVGDVVIPAGIVLVTRGAQGDAGPVGQVVKLFGEMAPGDMVVPMDSVDLSSTAQPQPVTDGKWASIQWILSSPVLPTVQSYAVLNITSKDGVKPGDEFTVFRAPDRQEKGREPGLPEVIIGKAQAIRVTPFGTTVMITAQRQPSINVGALARVSAQMPSSSGPQ